MPYSRIREAPESSSAATLRAVVAALADAWAPQQNTASEQRLVPLAGVMPESLVKKAVARVVRQNALDPSLARYVKTEGLARQVVQHYNHIEGNVGYPAIIIGAPNGGVAYLASLLQVPYLPAYFLLSFANHTAPDDIAAYQDFGSGLIKPILKANPDLLAVNHYDPIHDRFLVEEVNHVRLKLLELPDAYQQFITKHLAPDGIIFYADSAYEWLQYHIDERHMFQVGGLGGFSAKDYLMGSDAIDEWLEAQKADHRGGWTLPDYKPVMTRESEWGTLPEFREAVDDFAYENGYEFKALRMEHPEEFSALAYTAYLWESRLNDRSPNGLLVECFNQINPTAALRADLLPLWVPFNTEDSLEFLESMVPIIPSGLAVGLSLVPNFTKTPDTPQAESWKEVAEEIGPVHWIGVNPKRYPMDVAALFNYLPELKKWVQSKPGEEDAPNLTPEEFLQMMSYIHDENLFEDLLSTFETEDLSQAEPIETAPLDDYELEMDDDMDIDMYDIEEIPEPEP